MKSQSGMFVFTATLCLASACGTNEQQESAVPPTGVEEAREDPSHDALFREAGEEFGVPPALLKSIAFVQTRYQMVQGQQEFEGRPALSGLMALSRAQLEQGAALAKVTAEAARTEPRAHVRTAAALLSHHAHTLRIDRTRASAWTPAVEALSGIEDARGRRSFVEDEVFRVARLGIGPLGDEWAASGQGLPAQELGQRTQALAGQDYAPAVWRASPNYNARPMGVRMVVIHTCESSYAGCWSWLTNPQSQVSAHYVVREDGGEISQLVRDASRGWHIGATYQCGNNSNQECGLNGKSANDFTIGIEHGGYAGSTNWSAAQIDASARLLCDITRDHGIPRDRYHIVGHGQLQPYDRTDPGTRWPWSDYLNRANAHCASCSVGGSILVRYNQMGGAGGVLGTCTTNELTTPDGVGRYNHFQNGSIYWTPDTGAWEVHGLIRDKWAALGWETSPLGYPITNETPTPDGGGRYNHFKKAGIEGSIYWTATTGARATYGRIRQHWASLGWEKSALGYPVSDEYAVTGGRESEFQKGFITFTTASDTVSVRMK